MEITNTRDIDKVVKVLKEAGIVCGPTDTIYGLLADATNRNAVEKLYSIRRSSDKPFIVLLPSVIDAKRFDIRTNDFGIALLTLGVTVIYPKRTTIPTYLTNWRKSIALRVPQKGVFIKNLLKKFGKPLVAPSANPEGLPPAVDIKEAIKYFGDKVDLYVKGARMVGKPSTIVKLISNKAIKIVREGNIPKEEIIRFVKDFDELNLISELDFLSFSM